MNYCEKCGASLKENSNFCESCGNPIKSINNNVNNIPEKVEEPKVNNKSIDDVNNEFNRKNSNNTLVIIVALSFFIIIFTVVFSGGKVKDNAGKESNKNTINNSYQVSFEKMGFTCKDLICSKTEKSGSTVGTIEANIDEATLNYKMSNGITVVYISKKDKADFKYNDGEYYYEVESLYKKDLPSSKVKSCHLENETSCKDISLISKAETVNGLLRTIWKNAESEAKNVQ